MLTSIIVRHFSRHRSLRFKNFAAKSPNFFKTPAIRLFSSNNNDSKDNAGDDSKKPSTSKNESIDQSSSSSSSSSADLKLTKPGGLGKAGELRAKMGQESSAIGDESSKKRPRPSADASSSKLADSSTNDDDELISSSSSSSSDDEKEKPSAILTPKIRHAVKDVSKSLGGDEKRTRLDLFKKLMDHEKETYRASKIKPTEEEKVEKETTTTGLPTAKLGSLLGNMKVHKMAAGDENVDRRRSDNRRHMRSGDELVQRYKKTFKESGGGRGEGDERRPLPLRSKVFTDETKEYGRTDFFERGPGLDIFIPVADKLRSRPSLIPVWENLERRRLMKLTNREPRNGFEEFIRWTDEGKMHPFPIDNDYGHYEQSVNFHEHVFLDEQLEDGFPTSGPIRHFMELVIHGLSSNPYMSVEKKHDHIAWFRRYFQQRGAEIEKLHSLDLKHQQALAEIEDAAVGVAGAASTPMESQPTAPSSH